MVLFLLLQTVRRAHFKIVGIKYNIIEDLIVNMNIIIIFKSLKTSRNLFYIF